VSGATRQAARGPGECMNRDGWRGEKRADIAFWRIGGPRKLCYAMGARTRADGRCIEATQGGQPS